MLASKILLFPDPVLRKKTENVKIFGAALRPIFKALAQGMAGKPYAIGIAAPQIGISRRIAIVDVSSRVTGAPRIHLINPKILELKEEKMSREGCMSLPDYSADLKRYNWIRYTWQDETGLWHERVSTGIEAVCVQHEIDHLNGMLFIDRVASLKTDLFPRKTNKSKA